MCAFALTKHRRSLLGAVAVATFALAAAAAAAVAAAAAAAVVHGSARSAGTSVLPPKPPNCFTVPRPPSARAGSCVAPDATVLKSEGSGFVEAGMATGATSGGWPPDTACTPAAWAAACAAGAGLKVARSPARARRGRRRRRRRRAASCGPRARRASLAAPRAVDHPVDVRQRLDRGASA